LLPVLMAAKPTTTVKMTNEVPMRVRRTTPSNYQGAAETGAIVTEGSMRGVGLGFQHCASRVVG